MKRLLRGNASTSTSPTPSHNNTLPVPTKASVESRSMSESSSTGSTNQLSCLLSLKLVVKFILVWSARSFLIFLPSILDHYGSIWSGGVSSSYGYNTNPNNLSTTSTLYQSGQQSVARRNNVHDDVQLLHLTFLN